MITHLRVWSNNPRDVDTACGLFTRTYSRPRSWRWSTSIKDVNCPRCKGKRERILDKPREEPHDE
jgi:hypothetical protein